MVALNAWLEMPYFDKWDAQKHDLPSPSATPEHCSAFVATGSYTKDGRVVIAHNNWTSYETGERWNIVFDIVPAQGNHMPVSYTHLDVYKRQNPASGGPSRLLLRGRGEQNHA